MKKREQQHGAMVGVGAKNGKRSTRTVGQFFVVDFLSFYYKNIHTYLMDYCGDVMNTTIQTKKGLC